MASEFTALTVDRSDAQVAVITLVRPELHNRVDQALHVELIAALGELADDGDVRAVVLRSTGKTFSAGGDFDMMQAASADPTVRRRIVDDAQRLVQAFLVLPQPIIAAVQGPAIGLGATLVLLCDAVVAARSATFADSHVAIGLVAGDGGCLAWPQSAGMIRARRHLLTGDPIDAALAYTCGMVTDLVEDPAEVTGTALQIAIRIAGLAPLAVQGTKRALNRVSQQRAGEVVELSLALEAQTLASEDLLEGIAAFQQRRPPEFRGV